MMQNDNLKFRMMLVQIIFLFLVSPLLLAQNWEVDADALIRENRTGGLLVRVIDEDGIPVPNVEVQITQKEHDFWFGTAIPHQLGEIDYPPGAQQKFEDTLRTYFNTGVHESDMEWRMNEPERDKLDFFHADRLLSWADENGFRMRGHTIFWGWEVVIQDWVISLNNNQLKNEMRERVFDLLTRYRGRISEYDVFNEMLNGQYFQGRLGESIIDSVFTWATQADPAAILYLNEFDILSGDRVDEYVELINALLARGVPVGGIGLQGHFRISSTEDGNFYFAPQRIWDILETLAQFELPIKITEFDTDAPSDTAQARYLKTLYKVAFSHPAVAGILMWGFWVDEHWRPEAAIFELDFTPKPAALAYKNLIYTAWWTDSTGVTNDLGEVAFRPFFGKHKITATFDKFETTQEVYFARGDSQPFTVTIELPICTTGPPAPDPAWRTVADEQTRENRTGVVGFKVIDREGMPIPEVNVHLSQTGHDFQFGCAITSSFGELLSGDQEQFEAIFRDNFNAAIHENALAWPEIEATRDQPDYTAADRILAWTELNGITMHGHNLFDETSASIPDWAESLNNSELQAEMQQRVFDILTRYKDSLNEYFLIYGMLNGRYFRDRLGDAIVDSLFAWAKQANTAAILYLNEADVLSGENLNEYITLISSLLNRGVPVGGIGIRVDAKISSTQCTNVLQPEQIRQALDALAVFGLPIKLSCVTISAPDDSTQAQWLEVLYRVAFSHPAVTGIFLSGFWETTLANPQAALYRTDFTQKPAAFTYKSMVKNEWWTDAPETTDEQGVAWFQPYFGDYSAAVKRDTVEKRLDFNYTAQAGDTLLLNIELPALITDSSGPNMPGQYHLRQNYPNPFNPVTTISFSIAKSGTVKLTIYDTLGREVKTLLNRKMAAGEHRITFDAHNLPSGVYFYRLESGDFKETKKLLLVK